MFTCTVLANSPSTLTGFQVEAGKIYDIRANGCWNDARILTDAEGYQSRWLAPFKWMRPLKDAPWFALVGAIGSPRKNIFFVGGRCTRAFEVSGPLYLFPNDVCLMYWNNSGVLTVSIEVL